MTMTVHEPQNKSAVQDVVHTYLLMEWGVFPSWLGGDDMESNEMRILREFVEEFSPLHAEFAHKLTYDELFFIVGQVYESHLEGGE